MKEGELYYAGMSRVLANLEFAKTDCRVECPTGAGRAILLAGIFVQGTEPERGAV